MDLVDVQKLGLHPRLPLVSAGVALTVGYWLFGGLSGGMALAGIVGLAAWAVLWPDAPAANSSASKPSFLDASSRSAAKEGLLAVPDWNSLLEGIPDPAILLNRQSIALATNLAARELLSVRNGTHLSYGIRSPDLLAAVEEAKRSGMPQSAEVRFAVPIERALIVHVSPIAAGSDGDTPDLLLVFRDRTEEQQLAQLRADFVANASHELRTPLASVKGFIETLQGAAKNDPVARERFLGIMHAEASRMSRLIDDLLSLSRIEMREHLPPRELVDVAALVEELRGTLDPAAVEAGRTLIIAFETRPAFVRGDRDEIVQVLQNLVQNAIKYGREGGRVEIKIAQDGARLAISVTDDGLGIAPEHLPRLTERFYRVSAKDSRERGGTGLGLAIVKHIANRHRGELRIASVFGKGSTFTVLLPRPETDP